MKNPKFTENQKEIEKEEFEFLQKLNFIIKESLELFNTNLKNSMKFINYITLPIIMASIESKSFNPFSEIIEKHIAFILNSKMNSLGYKFLPLDYSSDLTYENDNSIIHIDIKTANLENPSDFKDTVPLGINQSSYPGVLDCKIRGKNIKADCKKIKVYPNIPTTYNNKLTITNALLFIYPDYKEIIDEIREDYIAIRELISINLKDILTPIEGSLEEFLNYKPSNEKKRLEPILDNIVRGYFIHDKLRHEFSENVEKDLEEFEKKIIGIAKKLKEREIKPVAILSISIPNGELAPHYDDEIVSGKSWGSSFRYHYKKSGNSVFKGLDNKASRAVFLHINKEYLPVLKKYFDPITVYELTEKRL